MKKKIQMKKITKKVEKGKKLNQKNIKIIMIQIQIQIKKKLKK